MEKNKPSFLSCAKRQQRWAIRKLSIGVCSVLLGVMLMVPSLGTVYAQENRGLDTTTHYTATGIDNNANLRYSSTVFNKVEDDDSLSMTFTYWFSGSAGWGTDPANKYAGKYLLSFTNNTFYKQIDKVILADISLEKHNDGAMWSLPVTKLPNYALIGLSRNQPVKITLKNGQTLESLNLQDTPIGFNSVLTTNKGAIASNSISNGYILLNNKKNENEKESGFTKGKANQRIKFNIDDMTIRSIHTFKPDENFLQTDYSWVVYVKEQIAPELLPYIDTDNIKIYCSDLDGVKINKNHEEFTVPINDQGLVDTSQVPELSIIGNDTKAQLDAARKNIDRIFFGTLGQSRSYTISYKLKDSVTLSDFARAANEYIKKNQQSFLFDSWMEADYLNTKQGVSTNDNGDAPKQLNNSYANAYLDANDTDKDGLFDFVEWKIGTDTTKVDTDGDGVPDGQEFMIDLTEPNNAADYLVSKPTTTTTTFDSTKKTTIEGTVPKTLIADPADPARLIQITNENAGNVIVKLQGYDKNTKTYTTDEYGTVKIPYKDLVAGNFSLDVNANVVPDGTEVVLVAYSPNADNPIMGDPFTFTTPDADKYNVKGGTLNQDYGKKAEEAAILDKVTVTETKDGQEAPTPAEKVKTKVIKGEIPTPTADGADQTVTVEVTYADGTKEDATVTIAYGEAKDAYVPEGQKVDVNKGEDPSAEAGIKNKDDLPEGTTYDWKTPVDTDTPGETTGTIVVTYPDGSKEEVEVTVNVVDPATDADKYNAKGGTLNQDYGKKAEEAAILDKVTVTETKDGQEAPAPAEKVKSKAIKGEIPTPTADGADQTVTVEVTYADGTKEDATVTIAYGEAKDAYVPEGQKVDVNKGEDPSAEAGIKNKDDLPEGTMYDWKTPVDTDTPGETIGTIVVTYPDGSKEEVEVTVNVVDTTPQATDTELYTAQGGVVNKPYGQTATNDEVIGVVTTDAPAEKIQSIVAVDAIPTTGQNQPVNVKVTYVDGTNDTVIVTVNYGLATDAYDPAGQAITVDKGSQPNAADGIANKADLPANTTYGWAAPVDTSTPGTTSGTIVVTYPDGSTDQVTVDVIVNENATNTELYTAQGGVVNKPYGQTATNDEVIGVVTTDAPAEKIQSIVAVDAIPTTGQNQPVNVKVTYADGSNDTVIVTVNYGLATDAYDPAGQAITVDKGSQPNAADGIANKADLPANTTYGWTAPVDTSTPGTTSGTVVVTYPDGSTDQVTVDVIVNDNRTDAEKYTPEGQEVNVNKGETPNPEDGIRNKDDLPEDTKYEWKTPVNTDKPGETPGIIVVTYPDGTTEEVEVKVNVTDPRTDADKYDPETKPEIIKPGENPDLTDNVTNLDDLPEGTQIKDITPEGTIDPNKPGEYEGTLEIQYPDGSKETVTVKVTVEKPASTVTPVNNQQNTQTNKVTKVTTSGPKTGDFTNLGVHTAAAIGSIATLAGLFFARKRRKVDEEQ
ncbi:YSIRK-type signal peptide-containing protein [[Clostridium] innocuum]|jgi:Rib/alpha/Esp surface antigen-like repeat protein|uniref:C protein alpha-antigen n=1 Tax=Clostridium innocuum TaxID=1522 RepID=A0A6N2XFC1_CLOIN|nr:Rib/alpha-like domain-containing protein [[Clostridium] innocuum]MCI2982800.1 YSIRK-type signal peptide-containing protein [[Clostridium] innocuum]MCI3002376.1 YSIRK-type signal peptide-containing protein [[Clostridium] innocuum]MCR0211453.1 YSIRK-type signal peptide-containing protein [[Clostridium] innocuum]MCR0244172.1 YSIRK-type signal peptide-containing protein [[Clostridium] innocuum]MCR0257052.1 YSIRK-type signal peptide-containing protein [[Clostridium] innocuum]